MISNDVADISSGTLKSDFARLENAEKINAEHVLACSSSKFWDFKSTQMPRRGWDGGMD